MKTDRAHAAIGAAIAVIICATATAQTDEKVKHGQVCHYLKASEIVGAKVSTAPIDEKGAKSDKLGEVKDIIVDTNSATGHGSFAVLSDGEVFTIGNDRLHGVSCVQWDGVHRRFSIDHMLGDAATDAAMKTAHEAGGRGRPEDAATGMARVPSRLLMFSGIKGLKVYPQGSKDSFGKVDDLWIDTTKGCTGYLVVSSGGVLGVGDTVRLVPWSVASIDRSADLKDNQINVRATKEVLESAPKLEGKTEPNDASVRTQACKNFGCEDPSLRVDTDRAKRMEDGKK